MMKVMKIISYRIYDIKNIIIDSLAIKIVAFSLFALQLKELAFWNILKTMICREYMHKLLLK